MKKHFIKSAGISLITGVLALILLYLWVNHSLETQTRDRLMVTGRSIEKIIENNRLAASRTSGFYGQPCTTRLRSRLQDIVITTPHMRALAIMSGTNVYCSSVFRHMGREGEIFSSYTGGRLMLLEGLTAVNKAPVLIIREDSVLTPLSALAEVDGYYLSERLRSAQTHPPIFLRVGNYRLTTDNRIRGATSESSLERYAITFPHAGFEIEYFMSNHIRLLYLWSEYRLGILNCMLLAVIVFLVFFRAVPIFFRPQHALEIALSKKEFVPYFQPVVDAESKVLSGGEILLRWEHPRQGVIPPDQFIPMAESSDLIIEITIDTFNCVKRYLAPAAHAGNLPAGFHIGINISPRHLGQKQLLNHCALFLDAFPKDSIILVLEITEREPLGNEKEDRQVFNALKALGIKFALDDFGTGYSTYAYLQHFPVDYLKIDKSFVQMIGVDSMSGDIVQNVIMLSQRLNIKTIAEGVENDIQSRYLIDHGVQYLQGYLYGRPIALADFVNDLRKKADNNIFAS
ncbi:TPA: EAL domain-containing protein [Salmonella enterica subsp. enterica serovar 13,23:b:-]|nr:EAL domain-containing protein [Salmonella enterica subsp. enterica]